MAEVSLFSCRQKTYFLMLRKIRLLLAAASFIIILLLFCDFTGALRPYLGFMAKLQLWPSLVALNIAVVVTLVVLTLLLGRVYCSVICPLGITQDIISWFAGRRKKNRFRFSKARTWLRMVVLIVFVGAFAAGLSPLVSLFEPYSAFGRIAQSIVAPIYRLANNGLAMAAEQADSYAFYRTDVYIKGMITLIVAVLTLVVVAVLAWRGGRTYCNAFCPIGTLLGFVSRYSLLQINIDTAKCNGCGLCARNCKSSCIDAKLHEVDKSRCVSCMDCIGKCRTGAISFGHRLRRETVSEPIVDTGKRTFLAATALVATQALRAKEKTVDGGLAVIEDKEIPERGQYIVPPGALSIRNFAQRCTACQLCVSACPNDVLRPSTDLLRLMQPEASYERGYCRPECTACSEVCPTGAIQRLTTAEKSSTQIGHAVWTRWNCIPLTDGVECGNCARHCPTGAITMVPDREDDESSPKVPLVDVERCIGCGACENLCPARPFTAIYVEGHVMHRTI